MNVDHLTKLLEKEIGKLGIGFRVFRNSIEYDSEISEWEYVRIEVGIICSLQSFEEIEKKVIEKFYSKISKRDRSKVLLELVCLDH